MTLAPDNDNLRSIFLMVLAMAAFAAGDMMIKLTATHMPASEVLTLLGIGGSVVFALNVKPRGLSLFNRSFFHPGVLARGGSEIVATMGFLMSLTLLPFSIASSILQVTPLLVTLGAAVFLRETVGWKRWSAISVGFLGVLVILNPGGAISFSSASGANLTTWLGNLFNPEFLARSPGALLALVGVVGLAGRDLTTRFIPKETQLPHVAFWGFLAIILAGGLLSLFGDDWVMPTLYSGSLMLALIALGVIGYLAITQAMRAGDISAVAPFRYTRIVFAFILGVIVFGETLTSRTLLGASLIVGAGLYTLFREKRRLVPAHSQSGSR